MKKLLSIAVILGAMACKSDKKQETTEEEETYTIPADNGSAQKNTFRRKYRQRKKKYTPNFVWPVTYPQDKESRELTPH